MDYCKRHLILGKDLEGCGCHDTEHKCCPDNFTPAEGPRYKGCQCHTYKYGCCPDGIRVARGPGQVILLLFLQFFSIFTS